MWDFDQRKYIDSQGFASFEDSGVLNATLEDIVERIKTLESFASEAPDRFLRKDAEDTTSHLTTFEKGLYSDIIRSRNFGSGMAGSGFQIKHDENGSHLEVDFATFRKKAYFHELVIQQISHQGGILFFSPARMECSEVQITADGFKCFFDTKSGTVSNDFVVGDQARCQRFQLGLTTAKYYWRLVTEVGSDYIVLSLNDADLGSDQPEAGDLIVALGNRTEKERQAAKITTVIGFNAPRDEYYEGIDSYDLTGRLVTVVGVNEGKVGVFTEHGTFSGSVVIGANSAGLENLAEWADKQSQINQAHATASEAALLAQQSASALKALEKTLEGINDDRVLSVSEKFSLRTEWEKINGLASLRSNGSSGSYRSTLKMIDELGYKQGENILLSYGDFVLTYKGIRIVYNQTGVENFNLAYEALKEYFVSVRLYQNEPAQNFDRQEAAKLLTAYYDTQSELLSLAQKYHALTASSQALENFVNTTYKENIEELRKSIDGKSQTHRQPEDPSVLWTDEESKATHENDIWWNTSEQTINGVPAGATAIYTKSGDSYIWELAPVPKEVFDSIDGKAEIFVSKPTAYNERDLWIVEDDDVMKDQGYKAGTLLISSTASDAFNAEHWSKRDHYTDDTRADEAYKLASEASQAAATAQQSAAAANDLAGLATKAAEEAKTDANTSLENAQAAQKAAEDAQAYAEAVETLANETKILVETLETSKVGTDEYNKAVADLTAAAGDAQSLADQAAQRAEAAAQAAQTAQSAADIAKSEADKATKTLSDWSSDKIISPVEKSGISDELAFIVADKEDIEYQRALYSLESEADLYQAYLAGYDAYKADLDTILGVSGSVAVPEGMAEHQATFYNARTAILNAIAAAAKLVADNAQEAADTAQYAADAAQALADEAYKYADKLQVLINRLNDDSILDISEKFSLRTEWEKINGLASLVETGSSGSYQTALRTLEALGYNQGENIVITFNGQALDYNGIRIVYNQTGVENFNLAYEALKEYFISVRLYQDEPTEGFNRQEAAKFLTAYYDSRSELLDMAQKYHALTASSQALENFVNTTYKENIEELRKSIDGKSQTHRQPEDPSVLWTDEESKATHENDIWWNTSEQTINGVPAGATAIYTKSGNSYIWELAPVPKEVFDSIDGKAEIFVSKPTAYNKNDVWILESDEVMTGHKAGTMLFATTASDTFDANHWKDRVRYTDDTAAEAARALAAAAAEAAQAAQNAANNAQTKADNAAKTLSDWSSDKIISPVEKSGVSDERAFIIADKTDIDNQRSRYTISTTNSVYTAYVSGYNTYKADLDTILGASGSVAVPEGMAEHQATFYNARTAILNAIAAAAKLVADNAQEAADDAQEAADAAKERADAAYAYAEGLKDLLEQIDDDTILNISEKRSIRTQWEMISGAASLIATGPNGSYPKAVEIAEDLGLEAGQKSLLVFNGYKIAYNGTIIQYYVSGFAALTSAYEHLRDYLSSVRLYQDDSTEQFNRQEFASRITAYYAAEASFMAAAQAAYTDKKTDETKQLVTDLEYLAAAFKNSLEVNGVVMSEMVAVKANNVIKAFLNGSAFGSSAEHGVLFLAGGIPSRAASGSTNLEDRAREAKTRAFDDGSFYSEKATFKQAIITNETSYTVIDDSTTRNPPDRSEYHIDGSAYRNFDIHFKGCSLWDVEEEDPTYGGLYPTSASQVEDFTLVVDNMAVGVIYTAILAFEHIGGQEYNHGGLHAGYDYENGIYGILKISISETEGGAHYDNKTFIRAWDVENNNIYNPYMCARLECENGQRCSIQFMKTQSGDIRVVSFSSDFIKTCVDFT